MFVKFNFRGASGATPFLIELGTASRNNLIAFAARKPYGFIPSLNMSDPQVRDVCVCGAVGGRVCVRESEEKEPKNAVALGVLF